MKKIVFLIMGMGLFMPKVVFALPFVGLYQTIDDATNKPKAIVALYEYSNADKTQLGGRIVATYDADEKISFNSVYVGQDIIWEMDWDNEDKQFENGKIRDPKNGKVYSSVIWQDEDKTKLNVRGKIGPFGRTQHWIVLDEKLVPMELKKINVSGWVPNIEK